MSCSNAGFGAGAAGGSGAAGAASEAVAGAGAVGLLGALSGLPFAVVVGAVAEEGEVGASRVAPKMTRAATMRLRMPTT